MKFELKELLDVILSSEMEKEAKVELLDRIYKTGTIAPGFYLRREDSTDELECWYRNVDENGMTDHGPTNYTPEQVVGLYVDSLEKGNAK